MKKDKKGKIWLWVKVVVLSVLIICMVAMFVIPRLQDKMEDATDMRLTNINSTFQHADSVKVQQTEDVQVVK